MVRATQVTPSAILSFEGKEPWKTECMCCSKIPRKEFYAWHELGIDEQKAMKLCGWKNPRGHPNLEKKEGSRYGVTCSEECESNFLKKLEEVQEENCRAFLKNLETA